MNRSVQELRGSFRTEYLDYDALTAQLEQWANAYPDFVRKESLGTSLEGREIWLLKIGFEPDRIRPAVWVDGNMHASELCGSALALSIAESLIALHNGEEDSVVELSKSSCSTLKELLFYIVPRISPDGAEMVLKTGRYVRSVPDDKRIRGDQAYWKSLDLNGDGKMLLMRKKDPTGEFIESRDFPGLMLPRTIDDEGPFFKIYPEGVVENFDGSTIPNPHFLSDNDCDLNRNFSWSWMPEPIQAGAGDFPGYRVESRAIMEFAQAHPEIFYWLNLHTFGGVFIRPLGDKPDSKMDPYDRAVYRQVEQWAEDLTGYPMVSGFEEFLYEPEKPLHGDLSDYAYHQRGCLSYVVELWDIFHRLGIPRPKRFVDYYTQLTRNDMINLARWDRDHNQGRVIQAWEKMEHHQLGEVEVGGLNPVIGLWNPPVEEIDNILHPHTVHALRVSSLAPQIHLTKPVVNKYGADLFHVSLQAENLGYLPSYILGSAQGAQVNQELVAKIHVEGCKLVENESDIQPLGHLEGWGRGLFDDSGALYFQRSKGSVSRKTVRFVVQGKGTCRIEVGNTRMGQHSITIKVE